MVLCYYVTMVDSRVPVVLSVEVDRALFQARPGHTGVATNLTSINVRIREVLIFRYSGIYPLHRPILVNFF